MDIISIIKFISSLLYPLGLVIVFLVLGWCGRLLFLQGTKRRLANACCVLSVGILLLFSNTMVATFLVSSLEQQYPQVSVTDISKHDAVIVLGGGLRIPLPPAKYSQLTSGSDRYWYATRLFKAGKVDKIIIAGGNVYEQTGYHGEAYYASELMQEWGVPESAIVIEDQSRTTEQNMRNTQSVIVEQGVKSAILVTSATHMPRAYHLFSRLSIPLTPASADVIVRQSQAPTVFSFMPSVAALHLSTIALHEYYGKWFVELKALISKA